ncbi:hypothetical protein HYQ46_002654 [Verticillium longisporum]|nr:hypothetical protein HYQ46_002654 [Verticillium longisporum]
MVSRQVRRSNQASTQARDARLEDERRWLRKAKDTQKLLWLMLFKTGEELPTMRLGENADQGVSVGNGGMSRNRLIAFFASEHNVVLDMQTDSISSPARHQEATQGPA